MISNILDGLNLKIYSTMRKTLSSFLFLIIFLSMSKAELNKPYYHRQFRLKSLGPLTSAYKPLFSGDGGSFPAALRECTEFCRGDRRCIGMEVCQIREDLYRCRACCEWMKLGEKAGLTNNMTTCRYFEMVEEETMNIAVSKPAILSTIFYPAYQKASNAVDNVINCTSGFLTAHSQEEFEPWLKIELQAKYDVKKVTIFNRQDSYGFRLHDLQVNVGDNEQENSCGFFKGPASEGDQIVVYCASGSLGTYVLLKILSQPGEMDIFHVCEVQVIGDFKQ